MIRAIAIVSLTALLLLVLYLPSAHPAQHFTSRVRAENSQLADLWSETHATRILSRTLEAQGFGTPLVGIPQTAHATDAGSLNSAVGREMHAVNSRLFNSPYFRSLDALLLLASYRLFAILEWLPWMALLCMAFWIDAAVVRTIKAKQFANHSPEAFSALAAAAILLTCATMITLVLPVALSPLLLPALPLVFAALTAGALKNLHRRG